ncbi:MAG: hypothetical protein VX620_00560 [Pseudomonadota bacterium]|nr:hypothetical protein [Pseudomonadota bacterium]
MRLKIRNRLLEDAFLLLSGNSINAACQLATTLLLANTLSSTDWGTIAVIISFVQVIETLFAAKSWQLVSSHALAHLKHSPRRFSAHFSGYFCTEICSNAVATGIALMVLPLAFGLANLNETYISAGSIYALSILFRFSGSAGAILRQTGKYHWQSLHAATLGIARLTGFAITLSFSHDPAILLTCLFIIESIWHIGLTFLAGIVLAQHGIQLRSLIHNVARRLKHINIKLVVTSHCANLVKVTSREIDVIFVSAFSGPEIAGIIKVYKSVLRAMLILSDPLANAAFSRFINLQNEPEISAKIRLLILKLLAIGAAIATISLATLLSALFVFWNDYSQLPSPTESGYFLTYSVGIWIAVAGFCLPPANLALKRYSFALKLNCSVAFVYLASLVILSPLYGATGAGTAFAIANVIWGLSYILALGKISQNSDV